MHLTFLVSHSWLYMNEYLQVPPTLFPIPPLNIFRLFLPAHKHSQLTYAHLNIHLHSTHAIPFQETTDIHHPKWQKEGISIF